MNSPARTPIALACMLAASLPALTFAQTEIAPPDLDKYVLVDDYLKPFRDIRPSPSEAGRISEIFVKRGEAVNAQQVILKLDTSVQESGLQIAKLEAESTASVDAAAAEVKLAQIKVNALENIRTTAKVELERARTDLHIAEARLKAEEENRQKAAHRVTQISSEIERRSIRSPFEGVVVDINKDISEYVSPNDKPIVHIVQLSRLRLDVKAASRYIKSLKVGMELPIKLKDQEIEYTKGVIEYIDAVDDAASGTFRVGLVIENAEYGIRSGTDAAALIPIPQSS